MNIKVDRDVLCPANAFNLSGNCQPGKTVAPLYSIRGRGGGYPCLLLRGSITVEAAFCGTAFFLALFSLLYLFVLLEHYNDAQQALARAVNRYQCYGTKAGSFEGMREGMRFCWDEEKEVCSMRKTEEIPFLGGRFFCIQWYQQMKYSAFEGKTMAEGEREMEEYVYLTEEGSVYHRDIGCIYLNPGIEKITFAEVSGRRNASGGIYYACDSCMKNRQLQGGEAVFITPYGESYHVRKDCPGLKRTITKVPLEEARGMPACSRCG